MAEAVGTMQDCIVRYGSFSSLPGYLTPCEFTLLEAKVEGRLEIIQRANQAMRGVKGFPETKKLGRDLEAAYVDLFDKLIYMGIRRQSYSISRHFAGRLELVALGVISALKLPRELMLLKQIKHPNIIRPKRVGRKSYVLENPKMRLGKMAVHVDDPLVLEAIAAQCLLALDHIHERGIIHCNLSPSAIFLCEGGTVKLGGFTKWRTDREKEPEIDGELLYLAPEVFDATPVATPSPKRDMWSFGLILFQLLGDGTPPIEDLEDLTEMFADPEQEMFDLLIEAKIPSSSEKDPTGKFYRVMRDCLQIDPEERLSASDALYVLEGP